MSKKHILVAEDDLHIRNGLVALLQAEGYETFVAKDGEEAVKRACERQPDLILLDIMMPKKSGYDACTEIRRSYPRIPVIMLTAKGEEIDKVLGLGLGADDYITKPFGTRELLARLAAVLRRCAAQPPSEGAAQEAFTIGAATIDPVRYEVRVGKTAEPLSDKELKLITHLHRHANQVLSRDALLNAVWGIDYLGSTRTLDQHIAQIRKKLGDSASAIQTVHGVGYRLL
ncbi:MAG: response regulator transcription factor [Kiritimatiellaeota bacterium]|nr:response regulator transcription factor [Kiritimatiellota bacterium]